MAAKKSQRKAALLLAGFVAAVYFVNFFVFNLSGQGQRIAGGLVLVALGAIWIYLLGAPETLSCDRARNTCRLVKPRFLLTPERIVNLPLDRVRAARVGETYIPSHDGPGSKGYEVRLETADGGADVFTVADSARDADAIARRINSFLKDGESRPLLLRRFPWTMEATGAVFIILGALLVIGGAVR